MSPRAIRSAAVCVVATLGISLAACSSDDSSPAAPSLGPQCEKYYGGGGCCVSVAGDTQAAKDACAQGKKAITDAMANGGAAQSYESTCEQGIKAAQTLNKCK